MSNDPREMGAPIIRNLNYSEIIAGLLERLRFLEKLIQQHTAAIHQLSSQIIQLQKQIALRDQADVQARLQFQQADAQLRQDLQRALLTAAEAERKAAGVGDALDRLRESVQRGQEVEAGRIRTWIMAFVLIAMIIVIFIIFRGVPL